MFYLPNNNGRGKHLMSDFRPYARDLELNFWDAEFRKTHFICFLSAEKELVFPKHFFDSR